MKVASSCWTCDSYDFLGLDEILADLDMTTDINLTYSAYIY